MLLNSIFIKLSVTNRALFHGFILDALFFPQSSKTFTRISFHFGWLHCKVLMLFSIFLLLGFVVFSFYCWLIVIHCLLKSFLQLLWHFFYFFDLVVFLIIALHFPIKWFFQERFFWWFLEFAHILIFLAFLIWMITLHLCNWRFLVEFLLWDLQLFPWTNNLFKTFWFGLLFFLLFQELIFW